MTSIQEKIINPKLGLLELAKQLGSVSPACNVMGYSRDSFYRFKELYEQGGEEALMDLSRKKPILKNRVPEHVERAVVDLAIENPALGQKRASWQRQQQGIMVSSSGVRSIWLRNDLEKMKKRLKALEARAAQDGILLTEDQMAALEKAKQKKEAHGEIESHHPGYLGSQDTYLCRHDEGRWTDLSTDLRRYLCPRGDLQAVHRKDRDHGGGPLERPRYSFLCRAQDQPLTHPNRSRHRILRQGRKPRLSALLGGRRRGSFKDQSQQPTDKRHLRAVPSHTQG